VALTLTFEKRNDFKEKAARRNYRSGTPAIAVIVIKVY
jgi:hypothetical protein